MSFEIDFERLTPNNPNNPTLVFIHGAGGDKTQWEFQKNYFSSQDFGVIVLSLPGHGDSSRVKTININGYVQFLYDFLQPLRINKIILVGHSMGGAIIQQFMLEHNDLNVEKLVLIGTGAKLGVAPYVFEMIENDFENAMKLMGDFVFTENTPKQLKKDNEEVLVRNGKKVIIEDFNTCQEFDIRSELKEITKPTLIICGVEDKLTPSKFSSFLHENIPYSEIFIIPDSSHFVMQEKSDKVNELIQNWILK
ncbi:MAG: 2-hydroxy-6-oxononadienedioate/2-hydroxy-6-oxononatrienedioate hydrolase [Candidatus Heimdallarchaeota archaeon LC_3]|nr:MAG: 2-hydroxy-6-oxononadienedioate/2-hydroxy-6-oxononatrienedioate hydrolase [Candidatus Heimdallarchaeota archaeon LC_3]